MIIREITVGELPNFVQSDEYSSLQPKPITWLRAVSQSKNPNARQDDVALVYASENNVLLAFVGLLPNSANGFSNSIYSNSGWWVHPKLGKNLGLPLFLKAFQLCQKRMFFTDCTIHTKSILEKTGLFIFPAPKKGTRFFLRFYFGTLLQKKKRFKSYASLISALDKMLNGIMSPVYRLWMKKFDEKEHKTYFVEKLDLELDSFIQQHSENNYLTQNINKLNWIIQNPWVTSKKSNDEIVYPFSYNVENFRQEFLILKKGNTVKALLMLSIRDNHVSIPYVYYDADSLNLTAQKIWTYAILNKAYSLIVYHPNLKSALEKVGSPAIYKTKIIRFTGYSKELNSIFAVKKDFQDGESDVAFT